MVATNEMHTHIPKQTVATIVDGHGNKNCCNIYLYIFCKYLKTIVSRLFEILNDNVHTEIIKFEYLLDFINC